MDMNSAFPNDYLKASDLQGHEVTVTMSHVQMQEMRSDTKPVLFFVGKDKGLVLNKTNTNTICGMYGSDSDGWNGKPITLFPTQTDFQGRQVACVRVKIAPAKNGEIAGVERKQVDPIPSDSEVPF
jgi:hypothetical protein